MKKLTSRAIEKLLREVRQTLAGHEGVTIDETNEAVACMRAVLRRRFHRPNPELELLLDLEALGGTT